MRFAAFLSYKFEDYSVDFYFRVYNKQQGRL